LAKYINPKFLSVLAVSFLPLFRLFKPPSALNDPVNAMGFGDPRKFEVGSHVPNDTFRNHPLPLTVAAENFGRSTSR
jgi:hypothetical protein